MKLMKDILKEKLGEECIDSTKTFDLEIDSRNGPVNAIYDPYNRRLKLFDTTIADLASDENLLLSLSSGLNFQVYTKLVVYATGGRREMWHRHGFLREGMIKGFYDGSGNAELWTCYQDYDRSTPDNQQALNKKIEIARARRFVEPSLKRGYKSEIATPDDAREIVKLMKLAFEDYPTPIGITLFQKEMKAGDRMFRYIKNSGDEIVSVASAEIDHERKNAELTDCVTHTDERGRGHMLYILSELENDLEREHGITSTYSLTRAGEQGINNSFAGLGYMYTGRLFNNCRMPDGWESMNIWCRPARRGENDEKS